MVRVTRRESIKLASATALASLLSGGSDARAAEPAKGELMLMGPFSVGDLYESQERSLGDEHTDGQGPSDEDIAKAFSQCQLYVIDKKIIAKTGELRFADEEYPKMALSGKLHFSLKDNQNSEFNIYFEQMAVVDQRTDYTTKPPSRYFRVGFQCYLVRGALGQRRLSDTAGGARQNGLFMISMARFCPRSHKSNRT
jgi:hypothetical protein